MEIWKPIDLMNGKDLSRYWVNEYGQVKNSETGLILKPKIDRYGYPCLNLNARDGTRSYPTIHRLVACAFIPREEGKNQVNHKDGNKLNNHVSNLEWSSARENINHSYEFNLNKNRNAILVTDRNTGEEKRWQSLKKFGKHVGLTSVTLLSRIKYSDLYPILDRYTVRLEDLGSLGKSANTKRDGKLAYCLDLVTDEIRRYPSINVLRYHHGLGMSFLNMRKAGYYFIRSLGYVVGTRGFKNRNLNWNVSQSDKDNFLRNREKSRKKPGLRRFRVFYVRNYLTGEVVKFTKRPDLFLFIYSHALLEAPYKFMLFEDSDSSGHRFELLYGLGVYGFVFDQEPLWPDISEEEVLKSFSMKKAVRIKTVHSTKQSL